MNATAQLGLFDAPVVMPYGSLPGHAASETSTAGARAIKPRAGSLQMRVLQSLHVMPGLTSRGLDRVLGTTNTRSAWPRCTELKTAGCIEEVGRCQEETGVWVSCWGLTAAGEKRLRELSRGSR